MGTQIFKTFDISTSVKYVTTFLKEDCFLRTMEGVGHMKRLQVGLAGLLLSACVPKHSQLYSARISTELVAMHFERQQEQRDVPKICQDYIITTNGNPATLRVVYEKQDENKPTEDSWQHRLSLEYTFKGVNKGIEWAGIEYDGTDKILERVHWRKDGASESEEKPFQALTQREKEWFLTLYNEGVYFLAVFMQSADYVFQEYLVDCEEQQPLQTKEIPKIISRVSKKYVPERFADMRTARVPYVAQQLIERTDILALPLPPSYKEAGTMQKYTPAQDDKKNDFRNEEVLIHEHLLMPGDGMR